MRKVTTLDVGQLRGMDEDDLQGAPDAAELIVDMQHDPEGFWRQMPGSLQVGVHAANSGRILNVVWFESAPNVRWFVIERTATDGKSTLRYVDWPATGGIDITTRRRQAGDVPSTFIQIGRWLYHFNGIEQPVRWDGSRLVPVGFYGPTPGPRVSGPSDGTDLYDIAWATWGSLAGSSVYQRGVGEHPGSGADAPWVYGYALSIVNDLGQESPRSSIVYVRGINPTSDDLKRMVRHVIGRMPDHIHGIRIWRTTNLYNLPADALADPPLYHHSSWPTGAGFDLLDHTPDNELGEQHLDTDTGEIPLGASAAAFWSGSLWLATDEGLRYSAPGFPEQFPWGNRIPVGTSATGRVTAMVPVPRGLVVFTARAVYIVQRSGSGAPVAEHVADEGTEAPKSIVLLPQGLAWVGPNGPRLMVGTVQDDQPTQVSPIPGIRRTWRRYIQGTNLATAIAIHDPTFREVWWHLPEGGDPRPKRGLVWHYGIGGWSQRPDWPIASATVYKGRTWVGSWDDTTDGKAGTHLLTYASSTKFGTTLAPVYATGPARLPSRCALQKVTLQTFATYDTFDVAVRKDRELTWSSQVSARSALLSDVDLDRWGTATFASGSTWGDYPLAPVDVSIYQTNAWTHQVKFSGAYLRVTGYQLHHDPIDGEIPRRER